MATDVTPERSAFLSTWSRRPGSDPTGGDPANGEPLGQTDEHAFVAAAAVGAVTTAAAKA